MTQLSHNSYRIKPSASADDLGRWLPVIAVDKPRGASVYTWTPLAIVAERYESRDEAERRSVELAKQMINRGEFKLPGQSSKSIGSGDR